MFCKSHANNIVEFYPFDHKLPLGDRLLPFLIYIQGKFSQQNHLLHIALLYHKQFHKWFDVEGKPMLTLFRIHTSTLDYNLRTDIFEMCHNGLGIGPVYVRNPN